MLPAKQNALHCSHRTIFDRTFDVRDRKQPILSGDASTQCCLWVPCAVLLTAAKHKNDVLPYCISSSSAAASGGSSTGGTTSNGHSTKHPPASPAAAAHRTSSFTAAAPAEAAASHHAWNQPQQQPQPPSRSAAAAGPVRPGQPRCIMMRTRGICTAGPNCPYDHTPDSECLHLLLCGAIAHLHAIICVQ